jgi:uncharacterized protein (DUF2141 family)
MKWLAGLALVSAFVAFAQDPNASCAIQGQVVNALTGEPVAKAHVRLFDMRDRMGGYTATTDSDGRFALRNIAPATYHLDAERNGFLWSQYGSRGANRAGTPLALRPSQELRDLVIRMTPQAVIMGRILDEDGEPMARVDIQAMQSGYVNGRRQLQNANSASTNDLGEYRIFNLKPGRYYLYAFTQAAPDLVEGGGEQAYPPAFYPGTYDAASAGAIEVSAGGQLRGIDMTLARTRTVRVRGRVTSTVGSGNRNINVFLAHQNYPNVYSPNTTSVRNAPGNFELRGVTPGSYTITAQQVDEGKRYVAQMPLEVGNTNVENVSLVVAPGIDLTGHVAVEGTADVKFERVMIFLAGPQAFSPGGMIRAAVKEKGVFIVQNLFPEHYQLNVLNLPENVYVKSIRVGTEDALESGINLTRGAAGPIEVLLASNGGQIDGTVLNAQQQPAAGATVVLVPESRLREQGRLFKSAAADSTGHFSVKGIAPGEYKLFAWEDVESGAYQDPDFLKAFEKLGESFSIHEGSRENAQLKLIPAEK